MLNFYKMFKWEIDALTERIGLQIKLKRLERIMSQPQLANEVNLSKTHISRIENGDANVTLTTLINVCNFLEIDLSQLFLPIKDSERNAIKAVTEILEKEFKNQNKRKSN